MYIRTVTEGNYWDCREYRITYSILVQFILMSLKQLYIHVATEVLSLIPMPGPSHYSNVGLVTPSAGRVAQWPGM